MLNYTADRPYSFGTTQGFVHSTPPRQYAKLGSSAPHIDTDNPDTPLPSLNLSSLVLSQREVAHAFHFPLTAATSPPRLHHYLFRGGRPYYAVDVSDIIVDHEAGVVVSSEGQAPWASDPEDRDEIGGGREGRLEVWGLTGWYLNVLMRRLGVMEGS